MKNTAVLLISCPDSKGIVATVANFLYQNNANILHADEHQDSELNLFFLRTEWNMDGFNLNREEFTKQFTAIAEKFQMEWEVKFSEVSQKVAIFLSKEDHCLADLLYRYKSGELNCDVELIISNYPNAQKLAEFHHIPFYEVASDSADSERQILDLLKKHKIDLVVLARYMKILSEGFIKEFNNPIINIHHSFLPSFIGSKPYHQAHKRGVKIIGATAHYATVELDQGPIIEQDVMRVTHRDNVENLIQKGRDLEKIVLSRAVKWHIDNRVLVYNNKTVVFD